MRTSTVSRNGTGVNDCSAFTNVLQCSFCQIKHGKDIGAECSLQLFGRNRIQILLRVLFSRIVHQYVEFSQFLSRPVDGLSAKRFISDISADKNATMTDVLHHL